MARVYKFRFPGHHTAADILKAISWFLDDKEDDELILDRVQARELGRFIRAALKLDEMEF